MVPLNTLPKDTKLPDILNTLFAVIDNKTFDQNVISELGHHGCSIQPHLFYSLLLSYAQISSVEIKPNVSLQDQGIYVFNGYNEIQGSQVKDLEIWLRSQSGYNNQLNVPITYLLDELICNIQQHSYCHQCLIGISVNEANGSVDICISDNGISLYGSYVKSGRYKDNLGIDSVSAICMAKDGFSTKNRPDAENRGYGISSNIKMVIEGMSGEFSIISGNALYLNLAGRQKLIGLPEIIDWQGTTIIVRIPINISLSFNLYDYIA